MSSHFYLLMILAQNLEISYNRVSVNPRNFQLILTLIIQDFVSPVLYQAPTWSWECYLLQGRHDLYNSWTLKPQTVAKHLQHLGYMTFAFGQDMADCHWYLGQVVNRILGFPYMLSSFARVYNQQYANLLVCLQVGVVHICEATLKKRLVEFESTESGSLTVGFYTISFNPEATSIGWFGDGWLHLDE